VAGGAEAGDRRSRAGTRASVSVVARRYDVNANQVFSWRKRYQEGSLAPVDAAAALMMVSVTVTADQDGGVPRGVAIRSRSILAGKYRVRVGSDVDGKALRRVLDVLERR